MAALCPGGVGWRVSMKVGGIASSHSWEVVCGLPSGADGWADESIEPLSAAGATSMPAGGASWPIAREMVPAAGLSASLEWRFPEASTKSTSRRAQPPSLSHQVWRGLG